MHQIFVNFKSQHHLSYISRCSKWSEITFDSASCVVYKVFYYLCFFVAVLQIVLSKIMINYRDALCNLSLSRYKYSNSRNRQLKLKRRTKRAISQIKTYRVSRDFIFDTTYQINYRIRFLENEIQTLRNRLDTIERKLFVNKAKNDNLKS